MKSLSFIAAIAFSFISLVSSGQSGERSETIKVWGNCGMCKSHIEKAARAAGASSALWSKDTKMLSVKYEASKTSNRQIQEKVAAAGYDTKDFTGDSKAYDELDECCKYDRKPATPEKQKKTAMNCCDGQPAKADCCAGEKKCC